MIMLKLYQTNQSCIRVDNKGLTSPKLKPNQQEKRTKPKTMVSSYGIQNSKTILWTS